MAARSTPGSAALSSHRVRFIGVHLRMLGICRQMLVTRHSLLPFAEKFVPRQLEPKMHNTIVNLPNPITHEPAISFL